MKINYQHYKLKNGMEILLIPSKKTYAVTTAALIKSGSALENEKTQGITHFVEHLSLATTEKWPTKREFNETLEFNGASYNGGTSKERLNYYFQAPYKKLELTIDFMHQTLYHASFSDLDIKQERTIILDEISKYEDQTWYKSDMFVGEQISQNGSAYILPTAGTKKSVKSFDKKDLLNCYKEVHSPERILLSVIGNFKEEEAKKLIKKYFEDIPSGNKKDLPKEGLKKGIINSKKDKKTDLVYTDIIFKGPSRKESTTKESLMMSLIMQSLGGPLSSRLMKRLRDEEGLLYNVSVNNVSADSFGSINIQYENPTQLFEKTLKAALEEIKKFADYGLIEKELAHYKEYIINRNLINYDDFLRYSNLIRYPIYNGRKVMTLEEINKEIKNFSLDEINSYIKKYFIMDDMSLFAYGNIKKGTNKIISKIKDDN